MNRLNTIVRLAKNDLRAKYANSLLGITWAFAMPLITILVFWYVFQLGFKNLPVGDAPFILWFSAAYVPWIFFVDITTTGCNSLVEYSFLVKKIKFDVDCIPAVKVISALLVHVFFIVFLLVMYLVYGFRFSIYNLQIIYYTLATCALGYGLARLLAAINVFFKDINSLYNIIVQIGFWVTPILWNEDTMENETIKHVLSINPMHYIANGYRDSLIFRKWFWNNMPETVCFWIITGSILIIGKVVFNKLSPYFADEV